MTQRQKFSVNLSSYQVCSKWILWESRIGDKHVRLLARLASLASFLDFMGVENQSFAELEQKAEKIMVPTSHSPTITPSELLGFPLMHFKVHSFFDIVLTKIQCRACCIEYPISLLEQHGGIHIWIKVEPYLQEIGVKLVQFSTCKPFDLVYHLNMGSFDQFPQVIKQER